MVHQLTEELSQLRTAHKQQMLELQEKLSAQRSSQTSNTQEELTQCKRHSCGDIQQYLQAGLKALEDRCSYCILLFVLIINHILKNIPINLNCLVANGCPCQV